MPLPSSRKSSLCRRDVINSGCKKCGAEDFFELRSPKPKEPIRVAITVGDLAVDLRLATATDAALPAAQTLILTRLLATAANDGRRACERRTGSAARPGEHRDRRFYVRPPIGRRWNAVRERLGFLWRVGDPLALRDPASSRDWRAGSGSGDGGAARAGPESADAGDASGSGGRYLDRDQKLDGFTYSSRDRREDREDRAAARRIGERMMWPFNRRERRDFTVTSTDRAIAAAYREHRHRRT